MRHNLLWYILVLALLCLSSVISQDQQELIKQALKTIGVEVQSGMLSTTTEGDRQSAKIIVTDGIVKADMAATLRPAALDSPTIELQGKSLLEFDSIYGKITITPNPKATVSLLKKISVFDSPRVQIQGKTIAMSGLGSITFEHDGRIKIQPRGLKLGDTLKILDRDGKDLISNLKPDAKLGIDLNYIPEDSRLSKSKLQSLCQNACIISTEKGLEFRGKEIQSLILKKRSEDPSPSFGNSHMRYALPGQGNLELAHARATISYSDGRASLSVTKLLDGSSEVKGYEGIPIFTLGVSLSNDNTPFLMSIPNANGQVEFYIEGRGVGNFEKRE